MNDPVGVLVYTLLFLVVLKLVQLTAEEVTTMFSRRYVQQAKWVAKKLGGNPLFYGIAVGCAQHHYCGDVDFYGDAPLNVVITYRKHPVAVVGFALGKRTMKVLQLQGLTGAKLGTLRGPAFDAFLLGAAEEIARTLRKRWLYIVPARRQVYFTKLAIPRYERVRCQERMLRRYDEATRKASFHPPRSTWFGWWKKRMLFSSPAL